MATVTTHRFVVSVFLLAGVCAIVSCRAQSRPSGEGQGTFAVAPPTEARDTNRGSVRRVDVDPVPSWLASLETKKIRVQDPVYEMRKDYEGYDLSAVVEAGFGIGSHELEGVELVFICSDGYRPSMDVRASADGAVMAFRDLSVPRDIAWRPLLQGREPVLPGPFYVVWPEAQDTAAAHRPWPYRIVALELRPNTEELLTNARDAGATVVHGAQLFKRYCITCHSMNLLGGTLGPELNVPANVTEYWNPVALRMFLTDPTRIRAGSKMPRFPDLGEADVNALVDYLAFMRQRKIKLP